MGRKPSVSSMEDEYLDPNFDPSKLTKPQLRSALANHGVTDLPPANVRKEVLVDLFREHVTIKSQEIIKKRGRVKASDKGIAFLDERSQPSPRRSPSVATEKGIKKGKDPRMRARSRARKQPSREMSISEQRSVSVSLSRSPQRIQKSVSPSRTISPSKRAAAKAVTRKQALPSSSLSPPRKRSDSPLTALQRVLPKYSDSPQAVTAKLHDRLEQIAKENHWNGAKKIIEPTGIRVASFSPARRSPRKSSSASIRIALLSTKLPCKPIGQLLYGIFCLSMAILMGVYLRFKLFNELPYCDNGVSLSRYLPRTMQLSIWKSILDMCIPCPIHGQCKDGHLKCNDGFIARPNLIAFGQDCVPDRRKLSLAEDLSVKIRTLLAERAGQVECGQIDELERVFNEVQLAQALRERHPRAEWNSAQFDLLYKMALEDIAKHADVFGIKIAHNPV